MYNDQQFSKNRPNVGVTVVPFIYEDGKIKALVYRRPDDAEVFPGKYAFPNCFYDREKVKTAEEAAASALLSKTSVKLPHIEQLHTFSGDYIDPDRINTVNITYYAILRVSEVDHVGLDEFKKEWLPIEYIMALSDMFAFNHFEVFEMAWNRIRAKADYTPIAARFIDPQFTIGEFQKLTELLLGFELNNARFRDRIESSALLVPCEGVLKKGNTRHAQVYRLNPQHEGIFFPRSMTKGK
ncbi:hypothetical protein D3C87_691960 [compost metagenome]